MILDRAIDHVAEATNTLTVMVLAHNTGTLTEQQANRIKLIVIHLKLLVEDSPAADTLDPAVRR